MKIILFTWMLLLVTALAVQAQTLTGRQWCTVLSDEDGEGSAAKTLLVKNNDNQEIPFYDE